MIGLTTADVTANGAKIDANGQSFTIGQGLLTGVASGTDGGLTLLNTGAAPSTLTLAGTSTYSGATVIPANLTLQLGDGTVNADATGDPTADLTISGPLIGATASAGGSTTVGGLTKTGRGTLLLTGNNTYPGGTTIPAGTLVASNGIKSLGTGTTTVTGGVLAGTGVTGGPATVAGGSITTGSGATALDSISTLTTGAQNWSSGSFVDKVSCTTGGFGVNLLAVKRVEPGVHGGEPVADRHGVNAGGRQLRRPRRGHGGVGQPVQRRGDRRRAQPDHDRRVRPGRVVDPTGRLLRRDQLRP